MEDCTKSTEVSSLSYLHFPLLAVMATTQQSPSQARLEEALARFKGTLNSSNKQLFATAHPGQEPDIEALFAAMSKKNTEEETRGSRIFVAQMSPFLGSHPHTLDCV